MADNMCLFCKAKERCSQSKIKLRSLLYGHDSYSETVDTFYMMQFRLALLRKAVTEGESEIQKAKNELSQLTKANDRRNEWLVKVRKKDYQGKYKMAELECSKKKSNLKKELNQLKEARQAYVRTITGNIFHLKATPISTSSKDTPTVKAGTNNSKQEAAVPPGYELIVNEDQQRGGTHCKEIPRGNSKTMSLSHVGHGALPNSEYLLDYLQQGAYQSETSNNADYSVVDNSDDIDHLADVSKSVAASLAIIVHLVFILSKILNQPLPHPVLLPLVLSEYGRTELKRLHDVNRFVAKQDDNIVYLCFTQNVDTSQLVMGDTVGNLEKLLTSTELGRTGPFPCYPELLRYPRTRVRKNRSVDPAPTVSDWDSEPPLLHTALSPVAKESSTTLGDHDNWSTAINGGSGDSDLSDDEDDTNNIGQGWEELQDMIVPSTNSYLGLSQHHSTSKERLEYGVSYSDYTLNYGQNSDQPLYNQQTNTAGENTTTSGLLLDTLGSLLGSGWLKK